jgi:hypothetical protein
MAPAALDVTGKRPITFTDSTGAQRFVPLSAFQFEGSTVKLGSAWTSVFDAAETTALLALVNGLAASGDLTPPPVLPPSPAIGFSAASVGPEGNNITVTITPGTSAGLNTELEITAKEVDTYAGLASADAAAEAIGVDDEGTGIVRVKGGETFGTGLPKDGQSLSVKKTGSTKVLAADGTATLFNLTARPGYKGSGIPVTVTVVGGTFTVVATHDAGSPPKVKLDEVDTLPDDVAFLVSAWAPPGGLAEPAAGTVQLSGGDLLTAATGVAYTS